VLARNTSLGPFGIKMLQKVGWLLKYEAVRSCGDQCFSVVNVDRAGPIFRDPARCPAEGGC